MKTLRVYGDSFAAPADQYLGWADMLSAQLSIPIVNKGVSGSSTEYSILNFIDDINNNIIQDGDIVVFVASTPGRLNFAFQNCQRPETASEYLHSPIVNDRDHTWYHVNRRHIEWWMVEQDHRLNALTHEMYINTIKDVASIKPNVLFIVLQNSELGAVLPTSNPPANFLRSYAYLCTVSNDEMSAPMDYREFTKYTKFDFRINHLTIPNLTILSNLLFDSIQSSNIDNITYDKFQSKNIPQIKSKEDYFNLIEQGLLYNANWQLDQF